MSGPYSDKILLLSFILVPFGLLSFGSVHQGHYIAFIVAALLVAAFDVKEKPLSWFMLYIAAWSVYRHFVYVFSGDPFAIKPEISKVAMLAFICGYVIYSKVKESKLSNEWFYNCICMFALIQAVLGIGQAFGYNPALDFLMSKTNTKSLMGNREISGMLGNQDFLAAVFAISLPFFFRKYWALGLILIIPLLAYMKVSTAVITALVVIVVYFSKNYKQGAMIGIACLVASAVYLWRVENLTMNNERFLMWSKALEQFETWPQIIFGFGPGSKWGGRGALHNDWLSVFHTFGIVGLSFVGAYVFQTIKNIMENRRILAAIVAVCVDAFGSLPMQLAPSVFLIIILFGLAQREVVYG